MEPQVTPKRGSYYSTLKEAARQFLQRKKAEDAVAELEAQKAAILEAALDCIIIIDQDGMVLEWNPAAEETFGHPRTAALGRRLSALILPPSPGTTVPPGGPRGENAADSGLRPFLGNAESPVFGKRTEMSAVRSGGTVFPIEVAVVPIRLSERLLFTVYIRDIADRKEAEEEARRQREWLEVTLSSIGDAVIATDRQGLIAFMNPVAETLTGWGREEAGGKPLGEVFRVAGEGEIAAADGAVSRVLEAGGVQPLASNTVLTSRDGTERPIEISTAPIRDHAGNTHGVVLVFHDVSERRKLERQLRERAAKLGEAHRRKDEFLAMLAHELRNPLAPVRNALHILRLASCDQGKVEQVREIIDRQVQHLSRLVDDLLDVSRITRGKISLRCQRRDWAQLVRTRIDDRRSALDSSGLAISLEAPESPVWVTADPTRLNQVFDNLLDNALKFTGRPGRLTVKLVAPAEEREAILTVTDTGIGIEPDLLPRLFEPFVQGDRSLDRSRGGLGLGLAVVKGLVEMHGGTVIAESDGLNRGATFTVRLPRRKEPAAPAAKSPPPPPEAPRLRRVLVLEDNRDSADSLRLVLEISGYLVTVAHTGPAGLETAARERPDIVLCDIGLPGMDGYAVASALRENPATRSVRLIALTGYGQESDRQRALQAGFDDHFIKPVDPEVLLRRIA